LRRFRYFVAIMAQEMTENTSSVLSMVMDAGLLVQLVLQVNLEVIGE